MHIYGLRYERTATATATTHSLTEKTDRQTDGGWVGGEGRKIRGRKEGCPDTEARGSTANSNACHHQPSFKKDAEGRDRPLIDHRLMSLLRTFVGFDDFSEIELSSTLGEGQQPMVRSINF